MSDLWRWFHEKENEYRDEGDKERLSMALMSSKGFDLSETDPQGMVRIYEKGRDLAKRLGEPWWMFFYEVWIAIAHEAHTRDLQAGLKQALHCVNESRKPILKNHPWTIAAYNTLLACYVRTDPRGHEQAIRDCLKHLDGEIPEGPSEHRYVMMVHHCEFLMAIGDLDKAIKITNRHQNLFEEERRGNEWYLLYPIMDRCWIGYQQKDWDAVKDYAKQAEEIAESLENTQLDVVEALVWQAIVAYKDGDEKAARRHFRTATNLAKSIEKEPSSEHYDAMAYYHRINGDLDKALAVRDRQLEGLAGKGRYHDESNANIKRCDLLAKLGQLSKADLERARAAMQPLKDASPYLERLERIEQREQS
jgi:ATP/maltotriose-dependent transcriptional regulator MalT